MNLAIFFSIFLLAVTSAIGTKIFRTTYFNPITKLSQIHYGVINKLETRTQSRGQEQFLEVETSQLSTKWPLDSSTNQIVLDKANVGEKQRNFVLSAFAETQQQLGDVKISSLSWTLILLEYILLVGDAAEFVYNEPKVLNIEILVKTDQGKISGPVNGNIRKCISTLPEISKFDSWCGQVMLEWSTPEETKKIENVIIGECALIQIFLRTNSAGVLRRLVVSELFLGCDARVIGELVTTEVLLWILEKSSSNDHVLSLVLVEIDEINGIVTIGESPPCYTFNTSSEVKTRLEKSLNLKPILSKHASYRFGINRSFDEFSADSWLEMEYPSPNKPGLMNRTKKRTISYKKLCPCNFLTEQ